MADKAPLSRTGTVAILAPRKRFYPVRTVARRIQLRLLDIDGQRIAVAAPREYGKYDPHRTTALGNLPRSYRVDCSFAGFGHRLQDLSDTGVVQQVDVYRL